MLHIIKPLLILLCLEESNQKMSIGKQLYLMTKREWNELIFADVSTARAVNGGEFWFTQLLSLLSLRQ
jgi:hypothetical protein